VNLNIFYHSYPVNDYIERFTRTYDKIVSSGLIDKINNIFVVTTTPDVQQFARDKVQLKHIYGTLENERHTLNFLKWYCLENDGYSLYLHSKGVTHGEDPHIQDWVDLMEYFCIEKYRTCLDFFNSGYNAVGCNYQPLEVGKHFSGNFWWAANGYLKTLQDLLPGASARACEFWLGSGDNFRPICVHDSIINHYYTKYPKSLYVKD